MEAEKLKLHDIVYNVDGSDFCKDRIKKPRHLSNQKCSFFPLHQTILPSSSMPRAGGCISYKAPSILQVIHSPVKQHKHIHSYHTKPHAITQKSKSCHQTFSNLSPSHQRIFYLFQISQLPKWPRIPSPQVARSILLPGPCRPQSFPHRAGCLSQ